MSLRLAQRELAVGLLLLGALGALPARAALAIPPAPPRFVYDGAGILAAGDRRALEDKLLALQRERGLEIGIAILPSLEGESVEDVSMRIAEAWRPGRKGQDTGVLVALFMAERKVRIEVGYGLEATIPDVTAGRIIRNVMVPEMRAGHPGPALSGAVDALAAVARGEKLPEPVRRKSDFQFPVGLVVFLGFIALSVISRIARHQAHRGRGLGRGSGIPWWMFLGGGGLGRGGGSGGSFGGGSFGGGSFGGGGASGGW